MFSRASPHGTIFRTFLSSVQFSQFSSVTQSCLTLCDPMDCSTPDSMSITNSWSLLKLMSIELVMPSNHLILSPQKLVELPFIDKNSVSTFNLLEQDRVLGLADIKVQSVQFSHSVVSDSLRPHESQHAGLPVHHQLPEFTQTHVHRVSDATQPSQPLSSPSPPAPNPSQHQSLFQ